MSTPLLARLVFVPKELKDLRRVEEDITRDLEMPVRVSFACDSMAERLEGLAVERARIDRKGYERAEIASWINVDLPMDARLQRAVAKLMAVFNTDKVWRQNLHAAPPEGDRSDGEPFAFDPFLALRDEKGGDGANIGFTLVDAGWDRLHPELLHGDAPFVGQPFGGPNRVQVHHGTRALCTTVGKRGIVPNVSRAAAVRSLDSTGHSDHVNALMRALGESKCGDVILFETQDQFPRGATARETGDAAIAPVRGVRGRLAPSSVDWGVRRVLMLAAYHGVTVVQPAGNGGVQVAQRELGRWSVLVGAAETHPSGFEAQRSSNSGPALGCYGPARFRTGSTERSALTGEYSHTDAIFGNTSAAGAVIAGIVTAVQGIARARYGQPLTVRGVQSLLADHRDPVAQGAGMPRLGEMLKNLGNYPRQKGCA